MTVAFVVAVLGGCRCGHRAPPESKPPSNEATSAIAYGLDWLPADTTVVARFGPGYGFIAAYLEAHPDVPECAWALIDSITASYMVHRYIADPPVKAAVGELPRAEIEACIAATFSAEVMASADARLTQVTRGTHTTWIGWADGMAIWHDDQERVLEALSTPNRLAPDTRMARLVARLPSLGAGVVTTADFSSPSFGVRSTGLIDAVDLGPPPRQSGRLLFGSEDEATAMMQAFAKRTEGVADGRGGLGTAALSLLKPVADGSEVVISFGVAWDHPDALIGLAEFMGVPTRPE
jgi:hypothetical protein